MNLSYEKILSLLNFTLRRMSEEPDIKSIKEKLVNISNKRYQKILAVVPENRKLKKATQYLVKTVNEIS
jgi:hypothetical protein